MAIQPLSGAKHLRQMLNDPNKIVVAPGVFDGLTARLALSVGFDALYMASCLINSNHGYADQNRLERGLPYRGLDGQILDLQHSTIW